MLVQLAAQFFVLVALKLFSIDQCIECFDNNFKVFNKKNDKNDSNSNIRVIVTYVQLTLTYI